jgi:hypothetical protein
MFNNYLFEWWEYGAASIAGAHLLRRAEHLSGATGYHCGNILASCQDPNPCDDKGYEVSKVALSVDWTTNKKGFAKSVDDLVTNDAVITQTIRPS